MTETAIAQRTVLVAGATGASGLAATRALVGAGARVVAVGRDERRLTPLASLGARTEVCDLASEEGVTALRDRLHDNGVRVDGLLHLVGGWRGGGGIPGQSDEDYRFLEQSFTALRHVTRTFWQDLATAPVGRTAIVSSTAVARPLAGGANYASVKAASEAWVHAVARGFATAARDAGRPLTAAAVIYRVRSLADREDDLARAYTSVWDRPAEAVNGSVMELDEA
ncbi:SDR family NAD(P)-dependent oxidoreductase [Microbacterium sp. TNHR37B]|uniref:SDR family NAD(P)-dependent oxidoreductase n=1 Tax=Microbacterium sp. TNHR37B TaxID=1775956 RepID=UPI0007B28D5E|nr:SDR family oxidoreductase [Microbacterium sp. TNHR37B]KZE89340.1 putative oxidoreductase [Microbacterium sp. TNHR37B]